ncbi:MAG: cobalamin-dependent protein [Eubacteriaceae bacterium]|nr:cobalamin-dependent protein [Eubacteriaceae bacterium]
MNTEELKMAIGDLDEDKVQALLEELSESGAQTAAAALSACQEGMEIVGAKYESGEYFVADLIFAGDLMSDAAAVIKPLLAGEAQEPIGKMAICTVKGDIHDIGKNIVKALLEASGIEAIDLGVDVSPDSIVESVKKSGVKVLALSGVLTLAIDTMKQTISALDAAGLRSEVKVIIGGAAVTAEYCAYVGADAWSLSAAEGINICRNWLKGV